MYRSKDFKINKNSWSKLSLCVYLKLFKIIKPIEVFFSFASGTDFKNQIAPACD